MFLLYAVAIGFFAGLLLGGRPEGLASIRFRWAPVMIGGLVAQVILFSEPVANQIGSTLGPIVYVASTAAVLVAVARNWSIGGLPIVVAGALSNLAAIVANGGFMPADPGALASLGWSPSTIYSNSTVVADPALRLLTDVFALPRWLPFANVFSVGDVLIGVGVAVAIVLGMRARPARPVAGPLLPDPKAGR
jgi:hypothetical protein